MGPRCINYSLRFCKLRSNNNRVPHLIMILKCDVSTIPIPANWRSRSVTVCFTWAQKYVSVKIQLCVGVERMVCFPCVWLCFICVSFKITYINIGFVCFYFEFTLSSGTGTWWIVNGFKSAHRGHGQYLNTRLHQFAGIVVIFDHGFVSMIVLPPYCVDWIIFIMGAFTCPNIFYLTDFHILFFIIMQYACCMFHLVMSVVPSFTVI